MKSKQLQVERVTRDEGGCERAAVDVKRDVRATARCSNVASARGDIRAVNGWECGNGRMRNRWRGLTAKRGEAPETKYYWDRRRL